MYVCPPDSKIKYSVFYNIYVLMFMYYTVCYFTGIFYAVVRQIYMLFIDNEDSVLFILHNHTWVVRACLDLTDVAQPQLGCTCMLGFD